MERLSMCRICSVKNVRMYVLVNKNFHKLYEKLTDIPFVTEDRRPVLACFVCCSQLKKFYRLLKKCLKAEELFAQILNEEYELKPLVNQNDFEFLHGFIKTPIQSINIVEVQTESVVVKQELPDVCEELDDILVPKKEYPSDDDLQNNCLEIEYNMPPHQPKSQSEDDVPLMELKIEVEEEQVVLENERKTKKTKNTRFTAPGPSVVKKLELPTRRIKSEETITAELKKTDLKIIQNSQNYTSTSVKPVTDFRSNSTDKSYKCDLCQRSFIRKYNLIKHIRTHTGEKPYSCDVCQCSFSKKDNFMNHIRIHSGEKPYTCDVCQRSFKRKGDHKVHVRQHTGEKPYKCLVCERGFNKKNNLTRHILIHTGEKPYTCNLCQHSFREKADHTVHMRIHTGEKPFSCDVCQRRFRVKADHKIHMRQHTGEKPYTCDVCQRSYSSQHYLTKHKCGVKTYKCEVCDSSFDEIGPFKIHMRIHTAHKSFRCEFCQRIFSAKSILKQHVRTHTGEEPYMCETCLRTFKQIGTLRIHVRTHTGERPYKCHVCERAFGHLSSLKTHVSRLHRSE